MILIPEDIYKNFVDAMPILCGDCVILNKKEQCLLVKRMNEPLKGQWWTPGGRVYKGEKLEKAVHRKIGEELGIRLKNLKPLGYYEDQFNKNSQNVEFLHTLGVVFQAEPESLNIKLNEQSEDWRFFDNLPKRLVIKRFYS